MATRISTLDNGYAIGNLSVFPLGIDNRETLYEVKNNAETNLTQSLSYNGKYIIVENNDLFPSQGCIRINLPNDKSGNYEIIYYAQKNKGVFKDLVRGFAGSRQTIWPIKSYVGNAVISEHHNALRDSIFNIETDLGTDVSPTEISLNGILKKQEDIFLSPKAIFRAHKIIGNPPLAIKFQNFSTGSLIRHLWDFGDGTTSIEKNPIHIYQREGIYSVQLNVVSSLGGQGVATKRNYITVSKQEITNFFYITPIQGISLQTAIEQSIQPTEFTLVDQTDGDIIQRYWIFSGDGTVNGIPVVNQSYQQLNPNKHSVKFIYDKPGTYTPSLLTILENSASKRAFLSESIMVQ